MIAELWKMTRDGIGNESVDFTAGFSGIQEAIEFCKKDLTHYPGKYVYYIRDNNEGTDIAVVTKDHVIIKKDEIEAFQDPDCPGTMPVKDRYKLLGTPYKLELVTKKSR